MRLSNTIPDPNQDQRRVQLAPRSRADQRLRWSASVWSPPPESNRRPHPYHGSVAKRRASRRLRRSQRTVDAAVMGSVPAPISPPPRPSSVALPAPDAGVCCRGESPARLASASCSTSGATRIGAGIRAARFSASLGRTSADWTPGGPSTDQASPTVGDHRARLRLPPQAAPPNPPAQGRGRADGSIGRSAPPGAAALPPRGPAPRLVGEMSGRRRPAAAPLPRGLVHRGCPRLVRAAVPEVVPTAGPLIIPIG